MFEGVSEIAGRVAQLQSALDSYSSQPSASSSTSGSSFQQTLADAQGAPGSGGFLSPNAVSSAQLSGQPVSVSSSGGDQLPPSASMLGSAGGSGLAGLTGGTGASGLAGLLGGSGSGASDLSGLLGGSGSSSSGLAGLLGNSSSGLGGLTGLAGTGGASSLAGLAGLAGGSGNSSGLAELAGLGGAQDTSGLAALLGGGSGGLAGLPAGTTPANLAALASLQAESGDIGLLDPSSSDDSSSDPSSSNLSGLAGLLGSGSQSMAPQQAPAVQNLVGQIAQSQGVNPALAEAVAKSESGFNPQAVSPAGAQGVMQLMPSTFQQYAQQASTAGAPAGLPVQGAKLSQPFGPTSETMEPPLDWNGAHYAHFHTGVDLAVAQGTPIRATMAGTIQVRSDPSGFGNLIVLENGPWDILLGHTSGHPANIQTGAAVKPGQVIGYVGSTGNSTGPHLHYEIRYNGSIIDPTPFLNGGAPSSSSSPFDAVANVKAGVSYLKDMLTRFNNNVPAALAAYNAGPGAVQQYGGVPPYPETQNYVQKTIQNARDLSA